MQNNWFKEWDIIYIGSWPHHIQTIKFTTIDKLEELIVMWEKEYWKGKAHYASDENLFF